MPSLSPLCGTIDRASAITPRFSFIMAAIERGDEPTETERFLETISVASQGASPPLFHGDERVEYEPALEGRLTACGLTDEGRVLFIARQSRDAGPDFDQPDIPLQTVFWEQDLDEQGLPLHPSPENVRSSEEARWLDDEPAAPSYKTIPLAPTMVFEHEDGRQIEVFVLGETASADDLGDVAQAFGTTLDFRIPVGHDEWFKINGGSSRAYAIRELREAVSRFGSPSEDFIATYLDICDGSIALSCDGERLLASDFHHLLDGKISFSPLGEDGVTCFVRELKGLDTAYFYEPSEPTFKFTRKVKTEKGRLKYDMLHVWVLKTPASVADALPIARALGMKSLDAQYAILPDHDLTVTSAREYITTDKGELVRTSVRPATLEALRRTYADEIGNAPVDASDGFYPVGSAFHNADVARSFNESALPTTAIEMLVRSGGEGDQFASASVSPKEFLKRFATSPSGEYFPGVLSGESVQTVSAFVFDLPNHTTALVDEYMSATDYLAIRHSSNLVSETLVAAADISKHAPGSKLASSHDIGLLLQEAKGYQGIKLGVSSFVGIEKAKTRFRHIEVGHHRIIIPLASPISIEEEGTERVVEIRKALAAKLGIQRDDVALETSYPFPTDADRVAIFGADALFDVESLGLPKRTKKEKTDQQKKRAKVEKEDKARGLVDEAIAGLNEQSTSKEIGRVLDLILDANLDSVALEKAWQGVKKQTKLSLRLIKSTYNSKKIAREEETVRSGKYAGASTFPYNGSYDFMKAALFTARALKKLNDKASFPALCRIDKQLVEMTKDAFAGVTFDEMSYSSLWALATENVAFIKRTEQGDGPRDEVPDKIAKYLYERAITWLPEAPKVCNSPRFLKNGTLLRKPGYNYDLDKGLNHYLNLPNLEQFEVVEKPTIEDVKEAVEWFDTEVFSDFNFYDPSDPADPRKAGRANAFAMLVTRVMREMIQGLTPMFFPIKAISGEGASLLACMPSLITNGKNPEIIPYTGDEEEFQKAIIAAVRDGRDDVFLDDITDANSKPLHRYLTSDTTTGRLLGTSTMISVPNMFNWYGSGINPNVKEESARRIVPMVLNSRKPPEEMALREFRHPDTSGQTFEEFIKANRGTAVKHLITMIQYWIDQGETKWTERTLPSFEDWARKVGGVLDACEIKGFLSHTSLASRNTEIAEYNEFALETVKRYGAGLANGQTFDELMKFHKDFTAIGSGMSDWNIHDKFQKRLARVNTRLARVWANDTDYADYTFECSYNKKISQTVYYFELVKTVTVPKDEGAPK